MNGLMNAIASGGNASGIGNGLDKNPVVGNGNSFDPSGALTTQAINKGQGIYLNAIFFDKEMNYKKGIYKKLSDNPKENGSDVEHEQLDITMPVEEEGYVYVYYSNESSTMTEAYFDDFTITSISGYIVQTDDYYPFGLTFNSYQRAGAKENKYFYNGKEKQDALGIDWLDYGARMYQPELGRFFTRFAEKYRAISPYQYAANDPINLVDINGDSIWFSSQHNKAGELTGVTMNVTGKVMNLSSDDIDMDNAVSDLSSSISSTFSGSFEIDGQEVELSTNVSLEEANSMDEVSKSDHVFAIADVDEEKGSME